MAEQRDAYEDGLKSLGWAERDAQQDDALSELSEQVRSLAESVARMVNQRPTPPPARPMPPAPKAEPPAFLRCPTCAGVGVVPNVSKPAAQAPRPLHEFFGTTASLAPRYAGATGGGTIPHSTYWST